jgi:hypothetical protein
MKKISKRSNSPSTTQLETLNHTMKYPLNSSSVPVKLSTYFNILFGICFSILLFNIIFNNHPITDTGFEYAPRKVVKSTIGWFVIVASFSFVISASKDWLERNKIPAVASLLFLTICVQAFVPNRFNSWTGLSPN